MILRRRFRLAVSASKDMTGPRLAKVSTTVLMIATVALLLTVAAAAIAAWVITRRPAVRPLDVPLVAQA